jgi:hypothetical protein
MENTKYPISKNIHMNNQQLKDKLNSLNACEESIEWLNERDVEQMWNDCPCGDWMLWLLKKLNLNKRKFTLCKGKCAETVKHLMKDERSIKAVEVAIRYGYSEATEEELFAAAVCAAAAYADATDAAAYAAAAKKENQLLTANIIRQLVPFNELLELLNHDTN